MRRQKIKHHAEPVLVGIGVMLAGAPALPQLSGVVGQVAIEQGRVEEDDGGLRSFESSPDDASYEAPIDDNLSYEGEENDSGVEEELPSQPSVTGLLEDIGPKREGLLTRRRTLGAQTLPALPLHLQIIRKSRLSLDPLGQLDTENVQMPYQSSPALASARTRSAAISRADQLLDQYDMKSQIHLLRGHYFSSEVRS